MDLEKLFPEGVVGLGGTQFLVKQGAYFLVVADRVKGAWVPNALGLELTGTPTRKPRRKGVDTLDDLDT